MDLYDKQTGKKFLISTQGNKQMDDFKLKVVLSVLGGIVFSLIFILLAFVLPLDKKEMQLITKPKGKLEKISQSLRNR